MSESRELAIAHLGAQGDGVAETASGPVYVPFTLPGERIEAQVQGARGRLLRVLLASDRRVVPPCKHFGSCGGCALQHMAAPDYRAWKREQVATAFRARGIEANVGETMTCVGKRRRVALAAVRSGTGMLLGFHEAASHKVVAIEECPVLSPGIVAALPALHALAQLVTSKKGETRVVATWTDAGLDVVLDDVDTKLTPELRGEIAAQAGAARIARVSVNRDPVFEALQPFLKFGHAEVVPPPGSFLQAVAEAEAMIAEHTLAAIGKAKSVADLFSGLGALTFRLAGKARVFAADSDKLATLALHAAAKRARGLKPIEVRVRDLFREPLSATELNEFDAVVFDPPRAGAEAQARMLARSKVKTIVAVSCNPATLARDARTLIDGGARLESVTPIDQFHFSPHIEAVAVFRRV